MLEAADGAAAIRVANTYPGPIHLLLTDVIMPVMNGRELAQRISALRPETRVLYMSGYTENVIGHNGMLDEGVSLLQKPFSLPALKTKVREVLDTLLPQEVQMARLAREAQFPRREKFTSPTAFSARTIGATGPRKTSVAPACCSEAKRPLLPTHSSRSISCCRRRLQDCRQQRWCAVARWCGWWKLNLLR